MSATQNESRRHHIAALSGFVAIVLVLFCVFGVQFLSLFWPQLTMPVYCISAIVSTIAVVVIFRSNRELGLVANQVKKLPARKAEITISESVEDGSPAFYALVAEKQESQWFQLSSAFKDEEQLRTIKEVPVVCELKQGLDRSAVVLLKITGVERELYGFPVGGTPALRPKKN
jgi:hypothetical protein